MKTTAFKLTVLALAVTLSGYAGASQGNITGTGNTTCNRDCSATDTNNVNITGNDNMINGDDSVTTATNVMGNGNTVDNSPGTSVIGDNNHVYDVTADKQSSSSDKK